MRSSSSSGCATRTSQRCVPPPSWRSTASAQPETRPGRYAQGGADRGRRPAARRGTSGTRTATSTHGRLIISLLIGIGLVLLLTRPLADRIILGEGPSTGLRLELLPGLPGITLGEKSLYPANDHWRAWLADEDTCPRGEDTEAPPDLQMLVLLCLVNYARDHQGLGTGHDLAVSDRDGRVEGQGHRPLSRLQPRGVRQGGVLRRRRAWLQRPDRREPVCRRRTARGTQAGRRHVAELAGSPREHVPTRLARDGDRATSRRELRRHRGRRRLGQPLRPLISGLERPVQSGGASFAPFGAMQVL